jgi:hypothetical protein
MLMSVATKIAIQLNVKMGGEVWALEVPVSVEVRYVTGNCNVGKTIPCLERLRL